MQRDYLKKIFFLKSSGFWEATLETGVPKHEPSMSGKHAWRTYVKLKGKDILSGN